MAHKNTPAPAPPTRPFPRVSVSLDTSKGANQADRQAADINTIVAQFKANGTLPMVNKNNPLYGDFTFPEDIHEVREAVEGAGARFMELPADVRTLAGNDWVTFLGMFDDPDGRQLLVNAGLIIKDMQPQTTDSQTTQSDKTANPTETSTPASTE